MFMQRLITSLILIPLVLLTLFYAPAFLLLGLVLIIVAACARECWLLIPVNSLPMRGAFLASMLLAMWLCLLFFNSWLVVGLIFWIGAIAAIVTFPSSQSLWGRAWVVSAVCLLFIPLFGQCLIHMYYVPQGKGLLLYLFFLVWAADIGAYLAGKRWGQHKLIPQVSPGKSWEGALGGLFLVLLVAVAGACYFHPLALIRWFGLALLIAVISIFGDLFISALKRRVHLKDTGSLIPGHGGVLDRLDSVIAALPFFYFGIQYIMLRAVLSV